MSEHSYETCFFSAVEKCSNSLFLDCDSNREMKSRTSVKEYLHELSCTGNLKHVFLRAFSAYECDLMLSSRIHHNSTLLINRRTFESREYS